MINSYRNVTKLGTPGTSTLLEYVVNIYQNDKFKLAYRYEGWSRNAVSDEVRLLENRFPSERGWKIEW